MTGLKSVVILFAGFAATVVSMAAQVPVRVAPVHLQGPRTLEEQTQAAVTRDYLQAWQGFHAALEQNRPELLEADFVGTAKDRLTDTIQQQNKLGIRTQYQDSSHDLQILFYSPDGLSIELTDKVEYDVQLIDHEKLLTTQRERVRYIVVLTPAEVRWKVRVFQSVPE
jgi:hypothetical protein